MAAHLYIHVFDDEEHPVTEDDLRTLKSSTVGSKYFAGIGRGADPKAFGAALGRVGKVPSVPVGGSSFMSAPAPLKEVQRVIGEDLPVCDEALIAKVERALSLENETILPMDNPETVLSFLKEHKGRKLFTVIW